MADKTATLKLPDGKTLEFPVLNGSTGPDVVDIRALYGKSRIELMRILSGRRHRADKRDRLSRVKKRSRKRRAHVRFVLPMARQRIIVQSARRFLQACGP